MTELYDKFYHATHEAKGETADLMQDKRALQQTLASTGEELIGEMKKHGITCIEIESGIKDADAKPLYIRLVENKKRTRPINIQTIGNCIYGNEDEDDAAAEDLWSKKVDDAFTQVQEMLSEKKEKERAKKAEEKKRVEKRKRKVKEIKKRKEEGDAAKRTRAHNSAVVGDVTTTIVEE